MVAYEVAVPSLSEAEAVSSTISSTTVADVDAAVATAVTASNETVTVIATAVGAVDFAATRTRAPTAVPLPGDDDASSSGSSGGVDAATLGGAAAGGAVLLLAVVAYVVYRRRTVVAEEEERSPQNSPRIDVEEGVDLKAVKAAARAQLADVGGRAAAAAALAFVILRFRVSEPRIVSILFGRIALRALPSFAGVERGSRVLQVRAPFPAVSGCAPPITRRAVRCRLPRARHGLAEIVERGVGV